MGSPRISRCSNCGASLPAGSGDTPVTCAYCGVENELAPPGPVVPAKVDEAGRSRAVAASPPSLFRLVAIVVGIGLVTAAGFYWVHASHEARVAALQAPPVVASPSEPGPLPTAAPSVSKYAGLPRGPAGFQWVDQYAGG
jgi:hypothetical protein